MKGYSFVILILLAYTIWISIVGFVAIDMHANKIEEKNYHPKTLVSKVFIFEYSPSERYLLNKNLIDIATVNTEIKVELAYHKADNFMDSILYPTIKRAFLQEVVALKLDAAQKLLSEKDSSLQLVVLDAARPQSIQKVMWQWAKANGKEKYIASPWLGSNHNFGCAVDVTLANADSLLDMGTAYDYFGILAGPRYEYKMLSEGKLSQEQVDNRTLLKNIMKKAGFQAIQTEWWHFNGLSKATARQQYSIIK